MVLTRHTKSLKRLLPLYYTLQPNLDNSNIFNPFYRSYILLHCTMYITTSNTRHDRSTLFHPFRIRLRSITIMPSGSQLILKS